MQRELEKMHAIYRSILGVIHKMLIHEDVDEISKSRMDEPQPSTNQESKLSWNKAYLIILINGKNAHQRGANIKKLLCV